MVVRVCVEVKNINVDKLYDYKVPKELEKEIKIGLRVKINFANRNIHGFILEIIKDSKNDNLKDIIDIIDKEVVLNKELIELGKQIKKELLCSLSSVYEAMLPKALKAKNGQNVNKVYETYYKLRDNINLKDYKFTNKQLEIIDKCKNKYILKKELINISISSLNTLLKKDLLEIKQEEKYRLKYEKADYKIHTLTSKQNQIYESIIKSDYNKPSFLYGVTGSGKTEIYMEIIEYFLRQNKTAILLVPEITLTTQLIERFKTRFKEKIATLHSGLSAGEKYDEWRRLTNEEAKLVIGARSAVFAPVKNLGVIIIDEEHSDSYKQSDPSPRYNAKEVALKRAETNHALLLMGSATPSLETYARAKKGVYNLFELEERIGSSKLPKVEIINMNKEIKRSIGHFSKTLIEEINKRLLKKEQIILLLNKRGYSSVINCSNCGYNFVCPNCDITLTYYKTSNNLRCNYCGYAEKFIKTCPSCKEHSIKNLGIGTEKIEEEIKKIFQVTPIRMDYDTTSKKGTINKIIKEFKEEKYPILLGTQMVSKGLDFPKVTLVGIINADTSLNLPDFRASENTYSLISQVAGRAGRSNLEGKVIIQTYNNEHYTIKIAKEHNYKLFFKEEMKIRKMLKYPPYYYLCYIKISGKDNNYIYNESLKIKKSLDRNINIKNNKVLGPSTTYLYKVNNIYRYNILIKYKMKNDLDEILEKIINHYKNNNKIKIDIDFNPQTMI